MRSLIMHLLAVLEITLGNPNMFCLDIFVVEMYVIFDLLVPVCCFEHALKISNI